MNSRQGKKSKQNVHTTKLKPLNVLLCIRSRPLVI